MDGKEPLLVGGGQRYGAGLTRRRYRYCCGQISARVQWRWPGPYEDRVKYRLVDQLTYLGARQPGSNPPAHRGPGRRFFWPRKGLLSQPPILKEFGLLRKGKLRGRMLSTWSMGKGRTCRESLRRTFMLERKVLALPALENYGTKCFRNCWMWGHCRASEKT